MGEAVWKTVDVSRRGPVIIVTLFRPDRRNAVDSATAGALLAAFTAFEEDDSASVAILTGAGGTFCAGADLKALAAGDPRPVSDEGPGPMGPTRLELSKPVVAAIEGHCVAGGLELALWCDLRVAASDAVLGVYCRRFGVPLVDGGTVRLPRLIGQSRALDLVLTGRGVDGHEAFEMGLVNRVTPPGQALEKALELAREIAAFPQTCLRNDRRSLLWQWTLPEPDALVLEARFGRDTIASGETQEGAARFSAGAGRHGVPVVVPGPARADDAPPSPMVGAPTVASRVPPAVVPPPTVPRVGVDPTPDAPPPATPPTPAPTSALPHDQGASPPFVSTPGAPGPSSPPPAGSPPAGTAPADPDTAPAGSSSPVEATGPPAGGAPTADAEPVHHAITAEPDRPQDAPGPGGSKPLPVFMPMEAAPDPTEPVR